MNLKSSLGRISIFGPCNLQLSTNLLKFLIHNFFCINHEKRDVHAMNQHIKPTFIDHKVEYPHNKFIILALEYPTTVGACVDSWVNFSLYLFKIKPPWWTWINSWIFLSLNDKGKNLTRKVVINDARLTTPSLTGLSPFHCSYQS